MQGLLAQVLSQAIMITGNAVLPEQGVDEVPADQTPAIVYELSEEEVDSLEEYDF